MISGRHPGAGIAATVLGAAAAVAGACSRPASVDPTGMWNLKSGDMTNRATGGVRTVLLRVQEADGVLQAEITSIRGDFLPAQGFDYDDGEMSVKIGAYEYTLNIEGNDIDGMIVSPLGAQQIVGFRQYDTLLYAGDKPDEYHFTRSGVIGHRTDLQPADDYPDPAGWVTERIDSPQDLALIVGRRHKLAVEFTNPEAFEAELLAHAGQRVAITGTWVGEKIQIGKVESP